MENLFYHYDSFELFGKKFHRIILLPDETSYTELNKLIKSGGAKPDGFFWLKLFRYTADINREKYDGDFDFDAEKEAAIICHESKETLLQLCDDAFKMIHDVEVFTEIIPKVKSASFNQYEDDEDFQQ